MRHLAFAPPVPLPTRAARRHTSPPALPARRPRPLATAATPAPKKAILYTTGQRLRLHLAPAPPDTPRYVVCPSCSSAYLGNAVTASTSVVCAKCAHTFTVSPADLYTSTPAPKSDQPELVPGVVTCRHMSVCPGCTVSTSARSPPLLPRALDFLRALGAPDVSVEMGDTHVWRTHAKLAVRRHPAADGASLGLFRARSHELQPIPHCAVHAPEINAVASGIEAALRAANIRPYDEVSGNGLVRYVLLTVHRASRKVQVTLVWNVGSWKDSSPVSTLLASEISRRVKGLHSLWFNWNTASGNAIVCPERQRFYHAVGDEMLVERVMGVDVCFPPYVFRQANLDAFEKLVLPRLLEYVPVRSNVAEFCAGAGVIGLVALKHRRLQSLTASEIHEGAAKAFWHAYRRMPKSVKGDVKYVVGSDSDTVGIIREDTDVIIVDPPRSGLSDDVVEFLAEPLRELRVSRIIYVSCGFAAFKEDASRLCRGQWKLSAAHTFVLFPGSDHIETLAIFDRVRKKTYGRGRKRVDATPDRRRSGRPRRPT